MRTRHLLTAAAMLAMLPACTFNMQFSIRDTDRAAVLALDELFCSLALSGDFKELVERFYTADALFMAPNAPAAFGRAQIEVALRALPPLTALTLRSEEIDGEARLAYSRGRYSMTMTPPGAPAVTDTGKFVVVYRRQEDGSWKVSCDIFNSDLPLPGQ